MVFEVADCCRPAGKQLVIGKQDYCELETLEAITLSGRVAQQRPPSLTEQGEASHMKQPPPKTEGVEGEPSGAINSKKLSDPGAIKSHRRWALRGASAKDQHWMVRAALCEALRYHRVHHSSHLFRIIGFHQSSINAVFPHAPSRLGAYGAGKDEVPPLQRPFKLDFVAKMHFQQMTADLKMFLTNYEDGYAVAHQALQQVPLWLVGTPEHRMAPPLKPQIPTDTEIAPRQRSPMPGGSRVWY